MVFNFCFKRKEPPHLKYNIKINRKWVSQGKIFLLLPPTEMKSHKRRKKMKTGTNVSGKIKEYQLLSQSCDLIFTSTQQKSILIITVKEPESCWLLKITVSKWQNPEDLKPYLPDIIAIVFPPHQCFPCYRMHQFKQSWNHCSKTWSGFLKN